jgi:GNAT superfamily N-acetyltransferase
VDDYHISNMNRDELKLAVTWAEKEGWNPGIGDADCYFLADKNGFFVGKLKDEIISFGSAVCYDDTYGFCGFYMVKPGYRGRGYGLMMTKHRLNYLKNRNVGLDGVLDKVSVYQRIGYEPHHKNIRFHGKKMPKPSKNEQIIPLRQLDIETICQYDRQCFPAQRKDLLQCWISKPERCALGFYEDDSIKGFGVIRPATQGHRIGPLFADSLDIAQSLLLHLVDSISGGDFYIDMPENNQQTMALAKKYHWQECFATMRMYLIEVPKVSYDKVFAITNFELG